MLICYLSSGDLSICAPTGLGMQTRLPSRLGPISIKNRYNHRDFFGLLYGITLVRRVVR
jgi:hypothetical protein